MSEYGRACVVKHHSRYMEHSPDYIDSMLSVVGGTNLLKAFLENRCVFGVGLFATTEELFAAYVNYCAECGTEPGLNVTRFSRELGQICGDRIQHDKRRKYREPQNGYAGIDIKIY